MSNLPNISIVTPTYNRHNTFRLAVINYHLINYPKNKIEWIIVDDGDTSIEHILPKDNNIKYYYIDKDQKQKLYIDFKTSLNNKFKSKYKRKPKSAMRDIHKNTFYNNKLPIGLKRNLCAIFASNDIIIHMDDDDYYPPNSVLERVNALIENDKKCVGCTSIGYFDVNKYVSIMKTPKKDLPIESKISEATLAYTKDFWKQTKFNSQDINNEGKSFIQNRKNSCNEIDSKNIIVALLHNSNYHIIDTSTSEPNGWHYDKIQNDIFLLITSFDK